VVLVVKFRITGVMCESTVTVVGGPAPALAQTMSSAVVAHNAIRRIARLYIGHPPGSEKIARWSDVGST
jgi:hypothetical protein